MTQKPVKIAGCALCQESFVCHERGTFTAVCCQPCIEFHLLNEGNLDDMIDSVASIYGVDGLKALGLLERVEADFEELGVA